MKEFVYYSHETPNFPLDESIYIVNSSSNIIEEKFIVSNSNSISSEILANEIDFYINNTEDSIANKIKNIQKLYEVNAIRFDLAQDITYSQEVSKEVLLVATQEQKEAFLRAILPDEFNLFHVYPDAVKSIIGHIGNLKVIANDNFKDITLNVSQIVWFDQEAIAITQSGSFDPQESSIDDVLATLRNNIDNYEYKKFTVYDKTICQYHERREEICSKCEEVCPTVAIIKIDEEKHLEFSQIDCHGCGGCISVCPSGALDYAPSNRETIFEMARFYNGHMPLIIPRNMDMKTLNVSLKENVLPFAVEGEKFLHEGTFLTILQESGSQLIFYSDFISKGSGDAISILNQIYQSKYGIDAILVAMNEEELVKVLEEVRFVDDSRYTFNEPGSKKREIFSLRLRNIVGEDDLGEVTTGEHIHYAQVKVNEANCTLCLACVGACNVNALVANIDDNSLRINPSICTACGYCEVSCPEADCLTIEQNVIKLNPTWFKESLLAKDTLFACVECGKEFATTKAVEKIATLMAPIFSKDPIKERTLYCCADCKPKIMMQSYSDNKALYNNQGQTL
ncbi:protein containing 4Fe-4S binding domain [Sulfurimonas gotlandica GD1]|uniref:Protein containing 4Fe-4S binding domain n=1 Tax=Sulfurimonas gotlandica (strain DSM 19862 / JCM 16533 / GD1) TaxID=929558 RepID=B6BI82_SULGG|nr:4Fe-4S binding protein [Sulfurimonas gotlandica]EDZ62882.1 4Fe-4S ferredoxin, iron-sulfur binding [Sulfurimonas gotlandica GD1]EHP30234.1 protein containing 4Fe-4S binding domain [Sulfurimonas gotlandica GD1]